MEKQEVVVAPELMPVLHATTRSVTVCVTPQLELELEDLDSEVAESEVFDFGVSVSELLALLEGLLSLGSSVGPSVQSPAEIPSTRMQGREKGGSSGKFGKEKTTLGIGGRPHRMIPPKIPPHAGQPTITGTTVE